MAHLVLSPEYQEYFVYLDELRESGVTNMLGSPAFVESKFDVELEIAQTIVSDWMKTFSARHPNGAREGLAEFDIAELTQVPEVMIGRIGTEVRPARTSSDATGGDAAPER